MDLSPLPSGLSNPAKANVHDVCKSLKHASNAWEQDTNPRHRQLATGALLSLEVSVMVFWVARGCSNWEVVSEGALAVSVPHMVLPHMVGN